MTETIKTQETPWGRIVSTERRIAIGEFQRNLLGLRFRTADYPDYVKINVDYEIGTSVYYAHSSMGEPFVLTDASNNRLGQFPDRITMTKWVKAHLVN